MTRSSVTLTEVATKCHAPLLASSDSAPTWARCVLAAMKVIHLGVEEDAEGHPEQHCRDPDEEGHAGAHEETAQEIAAEIVGAERMGPGGRPDHVVVLGVGVVGDDPRCEECAHCEDDEYDESDQRLLVAQEERPPDLPAGREHGGHGFRGRAGADGLGSVHQS